MTFRYLAGSVFCSFGITFCLLHGSHAATGESDERRHLEEIVVTGDRLDRQLIESAASVAVYSEEDMEAQSLKDLYDLLLRVPNVTASREDKFSLRGISNQGTTGRGRVLAHTFIDGIRQQGRGVVHTFDVEQIEIYRGPQSTAFGPNSLAGAIFVKTKDPTPDWTADLLLRGANHDSYQGGLSVSGPLTESLGLRLTADHNQTDGDVENTTLDRDDWQHRERRLQRGKLNWDPGAAGGYEAMLTAQKTALREGPELLPPETAEEGVATDNVVGFFNDDSEVYGLTQRWQINERWRLTAITTLSETFQRRRGDYDVGPDDTGMFTNTADFEHVAQELRGKFSNDRVRAVMGLYVAREDSFSTSITRDLVFDLGGAEAEVDADITTGREMDTRALFGEADFFVLDWLTVTAGARWEKNEATDEGTFFLKRAQLLDPVTGMPTVDVAPTLKATVLPDNAFSVDSDHDIFLPKLGVTFHVTDALNLFLTATSGYRAGGAEVTSDGQTNQFDPETTDNYDAGIKYQGERLGVNATVFYVDWHDQQVRTRPDASTVVTRNAGRSELQGAELEVNYIPLPSLTLFVGAGYVETRFIEFRDRDQDFSGNEFPYAPQYNYSTGFQYRHHSGLFFNMSYSYTDRAFASPENDETLHTDRFRLLNAKAGYRAERYAVSVYGLNLLDDFYVTDHFRNESYGLEGVIAGDPREVGISLEYHWR